MSGLFPILTLSMEGEATPGVNARDLHAYLDLRRRFADWIKDQIERADLQEGRDFEVFHLQVKNSNGGRFRIEYTLTATAAKEVALMSETPKGKQARRYLIEVEDRWRTGTLPLRPKARPIELWVTFGEASRILEVPVTTLRGRALRFGLDTREREGFREVDLEKLRAHLQEHPPESLGATVGRMRVVSDCALRRANTVLPQGVTLREVADFYGDEAKSLLFRLNPKVWLNPATLKGGAK